MKFVRSLLVLLTLLGAASASAQWANVAPNLIGGAGFWGAMQFRDGIVWAGANQLWSSTDDGQSWQQSNWVPSSQIRDIAFFDKLHGMIGTESDGFFLTSDGGVTWSQEFSKTHVWKVGYNGSASILHALNIDGIIYTSTDGGQTWNSYNVGRDTYRSFAVASDHTIYVQSFSTYTVPSGSVLISNDYGQSWNPAAGIFDGDCWTIAVDSCDPKKLYVVNEQFYQPSDFVAKFLVSTDGGQSWQATDSRQEPYFSGAMYTTSDGIFLGALDGSGVHRSMDRGVTWKSLGGPDVAADTRNLAAINDNLVLAIDKDGNIWRTTNGGGDSVASTPDYSISGLPKSLFDADTLKLCDPPKLDTITIEASACVWPNVKSEHVTGAAAKDYTIVHPITAPFSTHDSVTISFVPTDTGLRAAAYELTLDDGTVISVPLSGVGMASHILSLVSASSNEKTDTIGGMVAVPIYIGGLAGAETVDLVLHYPLEDLEYDSSVNPTGARVDVPGEQWPASPTMLGRSKLRINATPTDTAPQAYAHFRVFSDTNYEPLVTFDSVDVLTALAPCEYLLPPAVTSTIVPLEGCGIQMLSRWVHLEESPRFSIRPNPTNGAIAISSSMNVGEVSIEVYDMLGMERGRFNLVLTDGAPSNLSLPFESGLYYLRIISEAGASNIPVLLKR